MFKTWGSAMASLSSALKVAIQSEAVMASFGTPNFYHTRTLAVHRAFDVWCDKNGLEGSEIRQAMSKMKDQPTVNTVHGCKELLDFLPHEFSVRGVWTSEKELCS